MVRRGDGISKPLGYGLFLVGLVLTCVMLVLFALLVHFSETCDVSEVCTGGFSRVLNLSPNEIGDMIAGIAGALAFVWIIVSIRIQSLELAAQNKELQIANSLFLQQSDALKRQMDLLEEERRQRNSERSYDYVMIVIEQILDYSALSFPKSIQVSNYDATNFDLQLFNWPPKVTKKPTVLDLCKALSHIDEHLQRMEDGIESFKIDEIKDAVYHLRPLFHSVVRDPDSILTLERSRLNALGVGELVRQFSLVSNRLGFTFYET